jgi:demethylmenaquinone methyltransferase/2-methoxy-6-polyprenyl-1,4-benzoquinol methylase
MGGSAGYEHRKPLAHIVARYDRLARFYRRLEFLFLITPRARKKAVSALELRPGDVVLEIGAGTGRNLRYLVQAVGPSGRVIAIDASPGMLMQARRLVRERGWPNVELLQQDASQLELDDEADGILFSLSYSVIPDPLPALARAWKRLRPTGRLVVMDMGLTDTALRGLLGPIAVLLSKLAPGDAYSQPWNDLASYGPVSTERFLLDLYYVCVVRKPAG